MYFSHFKRIFEIYKGFNSPSYAIEKEKIKPKILQIFDYLYLFTVLKIMPSNYHLFCLDTKNRKEFKKYVGHFYTDSFFGKKFAVLWQGNAILVHDKYLFKVICQYHRLPVPKHYGIISDKVLNIEKFDLKQLMTENDLESVVLKPKSGSRGAGVQLISINELPNLENRPKWEKEEYIVEERIKQHPKLDSINPYSTNTIRIITFLGTDGKVEFIGAMLKTSASNFFLDNFTLGGIAIGIDLNSGKLKKEGFVKFLLKGSPTDLESVSNLKSIVLLFETMKKKELLSPGKILLRHPITQTEFHNFQIPFWSELREVAIKAQRVFYQLKSIGWDIAITDKGPVIIEGNQNWGTIGMQAANGGLLTADNTRLFAQYGMSFHD
jgi:hypothetical protein